MKLKINGGEYVLDGELSVYEAAKAAGLEVTREIIAADVNGETKELSHPVKDGDEVSLLTFKDEGGKRTFNHTASHILLSLSNLGFVFHNYSGSFQFYCLSLHP